MEKSHIFFRAPEIILNEILKEKHQSLRTIELLIIDEDEKEEEISIFEEETVLAILEHLQNQLNFLTILTNRPAYFYPFAEKMYEENGLIVSIFPKGKIEKRKGSYETSKMILDFEKEGSCYGFFMTPGNYYIPIYKKTWQIAENLDIKVPIGYNTVIVKSTILQEQKPKRDRFEEAFYKKDERQSTLGCPRTNLMKKGRTKWIRKIF